MATTQQIQQTADLLAEVTNNVLLAAVPLTEFPVWLDVLGAARFDVRLRENGQVHAHFMARYRDCYVQVHTTADVLSGIELPPHDSDDRHPPLPAAMVSRLESFRVAVENGAA